MNGFPKGFYRTYCTALVFIVLLLAYADRAILGVVIESIKRDFNLSDLQMGALVGPAFAIFYAVLGIPLARWSDVGDRRLVITICLAIWSLMTALGGACQSFIQLFLSRIGVGIGEAGAQPPTHSLVADYYPANQHGKAASALTLASFIGGLVGVTAGGAILVEYGWRIALLSLGIPGLLVAMLTFFTLREPRKVTRVPALHELWDRGTRRVIRKLFAKRTYLHLTIAMSIYAFFFQGVGAFAIPFFIRTYQLDEMAIGASFGPVYAFSALGGTLLAAALIDRFQSKNVAWLLRLPALCCAAALPCYVSAFLAPSYSWSLIGFFCANTLVSMAGPAIFATLYAVVDAHQRAMGIAVIGLASNLIGIGIGPLAVGAVSDALSDSLGSASLQYTLALFSLLAAWASLHMMIGSKSIATDYSAAPPQHAG